MKSLCVLQVSSFKCQVSSVKRSSNSGLVVLSIQIQVSVVADPIKMMEKNSFGNFFEFSRSGVKGKRQWAIRERRENFEENDCKKGGVGEEGKKPPAKKRRILSSFSKIRDKIQEDKLRQAKFQQLKKTCEKIRKLSMTKATQQEFVINWDFIANEYV